jgi:hypothetical protein
MTDNENLVERALNASSACLLPPLTLDLDTQPIARQDFDDFRVALDDQLHLLLDILYQNGNLLRDKAYDNQLVELRINLLILTCEQTEPNPFFQTDQKILVTSLGKIIDENLGSFDDVVIEKVVEKYKESLKKDSWKKQLGMIHSFPKFCEIVMKHKSQFVNGDLVIFMLSIGSNLVSHYEPYYKTIGLKIYRNIIEQGDKTLLKDLNIHQVIYSESFPMLRKSNEIDFNEHLYECLINVVSIEDSELKDSNWCHFDDVIEELLMQIGMESDSGIFGLLLEKTVKLCAISYKIQLGGSQNESYFNELAVKTSSVNCRTLRWIKKLMQMIVRESPKLLNSSDETQRILHAFHSIYIISISNTDPSTLRHHLVDFSKKIILMMMQVAKTFKDDEKVISSLVLFLKSISKHQHQNRELASSVNKILEQIK